MRNPVITPIFYKKIIRANVPKAAGTSQIGALVWTWSGIVSPTNLVTWPAQYAVAAGNLTAMVITLGTPDDQSWPLSNSSSLTYTVSLLGGGALIAAPTTFSTSTATPITVSFFTPAGIDPTIPLRPRIDGQPYGWAYDMTITVNYSYVA